MQNDARSKDEKRILRCDIVRKKKKNNLARLLKRKKVQYTIFVKAIGPANIEADACDFSE